MTQIPTSSASWAVEIESEETGTVVYYSVKQIRAGEERFELLTSEGKRVSIERDRIRKVLLMKTTGES